MKEVAVNVNQSSQCILITEGTTRSGRLIATTLAEYGAQIIIGTEDGRRGNAVRDAIKAKTGNDNIHVRHLNLDNLRLLKRSANIIKRDFPRISGIIHNTDRLYLRQKKTADGFESHYGHNVLAPVCLTLALRDVLVKRERSATVMLTSDVFPAGVAPFGGQFHGHNAQGGRATSPHLSPVTPYDPLIAYSESKVAALAASQVLHRCLSTREAAYFSVDPVHKQRDERSAHLWSTFVNSRFKAPSALCSTIRQLLLAKKPSPYAGCLIREGKPCRKSASFLSIDEAGLWAKISQDLQTALGEEMSREFSRLLDHMAHEMTVEEPLQQAVAS